MKHQIFLIRGNVSPKMRNADESDEMEESKMKGEYRSLLVFKVSASFRVIRDNVFLT